MLPEPDGLGDGVGVGEVEGDGVGVGVGVEPPVLPELGGATAATVTSTEAEEIRRSPDAVALPAGSAAEKLPANSNLLSPDAPVAMLEVAAIKQLFAVGWVIEVIALIPVSVKSTPAEVESVEQSIALSLFTR